MMTENAGLPSAEDVIAPIFVREALACGRAAGIDLEEMLRGLGLDAQDLERLSPAAFARIWLDLSVRMQDEFFGLGKRPMRPGSTTLMGHALRGAATLNIALHRALRFMEVMLEDPHGTVQRDGAHCVITLHEDGPPRSAFAYRTFFLILHGFTCWLARERVPLASVRFPCTEPEETNDYGDFFGVPVQFDTGAAQLVFHWSYLSRPVNRSEAELKRFLRTTPEAFLRGYRDAGSLQQKIIDICLSGPPETWPTTVDVAKQLGLSPSTLHRRLGVTGQSLGQIKDELKRTRATVLLTRTETPIAQISSELGYSEDSTFYRAFHRWYGMTPGAFRRGS